MLPLLTNSNSHLVLWLTHHSFEELPDALEYYLADPNSDLEGDLVHLTCLDPWGVQVHIHPLVTIYINTLLAWAKCFLATYGVYPGLYDLLDTPRLNFLAAQLHLHDSTLPRPLLQRSRGPPTIRSEYVALQPHLVPSPHTIVCMSVARPVCPSTCPSVVRPVRPSSRQHPQSVYHPASQSHCPSIPPTVRPSSPPVRHTNRPSTLPVTPSMTCPSATPPVSHAQRPSDRPSPSDRLYTILPRLSGLSYVTPSARHIKPVRQTIRHYPNVCTTTPPVHQTIRHCHTVCTTHQSVRPPVRHQPTV